MGYLNVLRHVPEIPRILLNEQFAGLLGDLGRHDRQIACQLLFGGRLLGHRLGNGFLGADDAGAQQGATDQYASRGCNDSLNHWS